MKVQLIKINGKKYIQQIDKLKLDYKAYLHTPKKRTGKQNESGTKSIKRIPKFKYINNYIKC